MIKLPSAFLFAALLAAVLPAVPASAAEPGDIAMQVNFNTRFAVNLYGRLAPGEGNLFFSPYSISSCMAMVYAGAQGDTEVQIAQALHFNTNQEVLHSIFSDLQGQLNAVSKPNEIELDLANGLWAQRGHPFNPAFLDIGKQLYGANLRQVDFARSAEPTRKEINAWVSSRTANRIPDLIPAGLLNPATRLVLVNAIYFKGKWAKPFQKANTADAPFTTASGQTVNAPLMRATGDFNYSETPVMQALELPYAGGRLAMVVLLPKGTNDLSLVETSLARGPDAWQAKASVQKVQVFLPKFHLTGQFLLAKTLQAMGMYDPFTPQADFSSMDDARDLYLSAVVHKAFIMVDEEGTEAAAATGTVATASAILAATPVFRADHPFVFYIRDTFSHSILFMGRVADPTK